MNTQYSKHVLNILLIALLGVALYSRTLDAPFTWDDEVFILENENIRDISNFRDFSGTRYLTYLSFALNYKIHGYNVTGYHIFNIAVHIINSVLVYFLIMLIFRSHASALSSQQSAYKIAFFAGLLFVAHPAYTQTVTYITQRSALLTVFFYLLSLVMYIKARLVHSLQPAVHSSKPENYELMTANFRAKARSYMLYAVSLISAAFAMKCKEIAFTLPIVALLFDRCFFRYRWDLRNSIINIAPLLLILLLVVFFSTPQAEVFNRPETNVFKVHDGNILSGLDAKKLSAISRKDYVLTEFRVILTYVRIFFLPVNLNYDYDYPIFSSFLEPNVFLSFLFLLIILGLAVYLFRCSRFSDQDLQGNNEELSSDPKTVDSGLILISFGILWFIITLSIESFVVVLNHAIFEYRLYLPSIGIILALTGIIYHVTKYLKDIPRYAKAAIGVVLFSLSVATFMRNEVLRDNIALWEDTVRKSPYKATVHANAGDAYYKKDRYDKAIEHYIISLNLNPFPAKVHNNLGNAYYKKGSLDDAIKEYETAVYLDPKFKEAQYNLFTAYNIKKTLSQIGK